MGGFRISDHNHEGTPMKNVIRLSRVVHLHVPVRRIARLRRGFLLALLVATAVTLMPRAAAARGITYQYVDAPQARIYSADVRDIADFTERVKSHDSMWKRGSVNALAFHPIAEDAPASGGILLIGANAQWTTDADFNNAGTTTVVQKVGHLTFARTGYDPIVLEPTVTLAPGAWTIVKRIDKNFDPDWHQYGPDSAPGLYGLSVDTHLQASVYLVFAGGLAKFECPALTKFVLRSAGVSLNFSMIRTDTDPHVGSYPTILNTTSSAVQFEMRVCADVGDCVVEPHTAAPGVSQFGIGRLCVTGCSVQFCLFSCSAGIAGALPSGVYPFISIGDGGTQVARLPQ
jgi:hypothetical protein